MYICSKLWGEVRTLHISRPSPQSASHGSGSLYDTPLLQALAGLAGGELDAGIVTEPLVEMASPVP